MTERESATHFTYWRRRVGRERAQLTDSEAHLASLVARIDELQRGKDVAASQPESED